VLGLHSLVLRLAEARLRVVHVALSQKLRRVEAENGQVDAMRYIGPFYPKITAFSVLCPRGNLVF
jgi:hypothetical protein